MLRGLFKLTWLEIKIFLREPLGAFGTIAMPVLAFLALGRLAGRNLSSAAIGTPGRTLVSVSFPVFSAVLIAISAVLSLVTIISIYRESGILKRLRATPLRPLTILSAHVLVKLLLTATTLVLMVLLGKRYYPAGVDAPLGSFMLALLVSTLSILSIGFVISAIVPTARFAQPLGAIILYPMIAVSGLFVPIAALPQQFRGLARLVPLTYAVSLLQGIWTHEPWSAHLIDLTALVAVFIVFAAISSKVFRWE
jgi:ABC-2 type transport system permease protein